MSDIKKAANALDQFYHESSQKLLKLLLKRNGGDLEVAKSVLQDALIAAYTSFHTFHHKSTYFTWICKIALNKLADYYRQQVNSKSKFFVPLASQINNLVDPALEPEEKLALDELRYKVNACLNLLPPEYRRLLHLKYYLELSNTEISLKLNLAPRALEGKLYRAKKLLAKIYAKS
jgi:RNA polymerase sigma-70 factor (ECF subfamily)